MKKIFSGIMVLALLLAALFSFAGCGSKPKNAITSNWKFDSLIYDGKTTKASQMSEDEMPMIIIDADNLNANYYFVTYRQNGANHNASMEQRADGSYLIDFVDSDRNMIAEVENDRLTLKIEGMVGTSIVFTATQEEILIPISEKEGPEYIKANMVGKNKVEITNEGDTEYTYGKYYQLEVQRNGKWYYARCEQHYAWTDIAVILAPGDSNTEEYELSYYGKLKSGWYRLALCNENACIYAYFTVNVDGTISYKYV